MGDGFKPTTGYLVEVPFEDRKRMFTLTQVGPDLEGFVLRRKVIFRWDSYLEEWHAYEGSIFAGYGDDLISVIANVVVRRGLRR